mgnify:CR=1 FL=1
MKNTLLFNLLKAFFIYALMLNGGNAVAQCGDNIDLGTWIQEGTLANGNWQVTGGGNDVNQTINGEPTFYVSPDSFINVLITGDIQVTTAADDDWIGFVFGYNDPDLLNPNDYDFYLFDWKQADQNFGGFFGNEGYAMTKIDGPVVNFPQTFSAKAGPFANPIATQYGPTEGWNDFQLYSFALTYTSTRTVISINGDTVIDEYGCFPPGRFGFYNYSQSNVQYSNFSYRVAAAFDVLTPNVCIGDTAQFVALSDSCENAAGVPINNTLVSWLWTFDDGATSNDTNPSHLYLNPGIYNVGLIVTDYLGCTDTAYSIVEVHDLPVISINPDDTVFCLNDSALLAASGALSYAWSPSIGLNDTTAGIVFAKPEINSNYYVVGTDGNGCLGYDTVSVEIWSLPIVSITPTSFDLCIYETIGLNATGASAYSWITNYNLSSNIGASININPETDTNYVVIGTDTNGCASSDTTDINVTPLPETTITSSIGINCAGQQDSISITGGLFYSWGPNVALIGGNTANPVMNPQVTQQYFVTATGPGNCQTIDSVTVEVYEIPDYSAGDNDVMCRNDSVQLNATGGTSYSWQPSIGLTDTTISNPISHTLNTRLYNVFITDTNGCTFSSLVIVSVNPLPFARAGLDKTICIGDPTRIGGQPSGPAGSFYEWSPTNGLIDSQFAPNPNVSPDTSTTYNLLVTDTNGCMRGDKARVTVNELPAVEVVQAPSYICEGDSELISITSGYASYEWKPSSSVVTPNASFSLIYPTISGLQTVEVIDSNGCAGEVNFDVEVKPKPFVNAGLNFEVCDGDTIELIANAGEGDYRWTPEEMVFQPDSLTTLAVPLGVGFLRLTISDNLGCTNTDDAIISAHPLPYVDAGEDIENCDMQTVFLGGPSVTSEENSINWSPADLLSDPKAEHPWVLNTERDTFYLEVVSPDGCKNDDTVSVNSDCYSKIYVPNAFSPDNNGVNDFFRVYGHRIYNPYLKVYDKWGHIIFESTDIEIGWDGTHLKQGNDASIGTYFWDFLYENERGRVETMEGIVNLIR